MMALALAIFVSGLIYDGFFAGLPYLDPEPTLQAKWLFHKEVAEKITSLSVVIFVFALLWQLIEWAKR